MDSEFFKIIGWGVLVVTILLSISIEYPIFGVFLAVAFISFIIWMWDINEESKKEF